NGGRVNSKELLSLHYNHLEKCTASPEDLQALNTLGAGTSTGKRAHYQGPASRPLLSDTRLPREEVEGGSHDLTAPSSPPGISQERGARAGWKRGGAALPTDRATHQCTNTARPSARAWPMKATHRSKWLSRSVSGLSSAGTKKRSRPSTPAPALKSGSSESTVSTAVMPTSLRWSGSATAAAPPRYSPGCTSSIRPTELAPLWLRIGRSQPWLPPCASNMAAPGGQTAAGLTIE
uniref:Uncharacterized protein n=1 Tax=Equus caballus TaxID=9796 RepID=A0A9L0TNQ8_HORSE